MVGWFHVPQCYEMNTYLLIFSNDGAILLDLRFRLVKLSSAHLLQLWKHRNVLLDTDQGRVGGPRDRVNPRDMKRRWTKVLADLKLRAKSHPPHNLYTNT